MNNGYLNTKVFRKCYFKLQWIFYLHHHSSMLIILPIVPKVIHIPLIDSSSTIRQTRGSHLNSFIFDVLTIKFLHQTVRQIKKKIAENISICGIYPIWNFFIRNVKHLASQEDYHFGMIMEIQLVFYFVSFYHTIWSQIFLNRFNKRFYSKN